MKSSIGKAFSYNQADNMAYIEKFKTASNNEVNVFTKRAVFYCEAKPIAKTVDQIRTWMILPYTKSSEPKAVYLFDHSGDVFANLFMSYNKQPLAFKGDTTSADAATTEPDFDTNFIKFSGMKHLTIKDSGTGQSENERLRVHTHLMEMRITQLPDKTSKKKLLMSLTNDKKLEIYLTFDKRFIFKTGTQSKTTKPFDLINFKWYKVKVIYTRFVFAHDFFDCSVEIDIYAVGRDGQELNCKS